MNNIAGQHIKGYELQERIGTGGFGAVYRAFQSTIGREVAMKIILPGYANHPDFIRRFEAEAHVIARLEHPYIVPLHDYWRDPDGAYLVMRYLRGGSLQDSLQKHGAFPIEEAVNLMEQVTQALHVAHRNQVIHRDIKPGNILLDEDGNAYLADFGIAKDHTISQSITDPDGIIGSPDYLAPEQARSEVVTPQTDIYSLGVVLYEVLEGKHPFSAQTPIERLYKHLNESLPDIVKLDNSIREAVNRVIQKATAKNPQQRFKDVIAFAQALREAAALDKSSDTTSLVELLTPREQEVLKLLIEGRSNREIADTLVIEISTVKSYINQLYRKLNVRSRVQAIVKARELDLIVGKPQTQILSSSSNLPEPENPYKGLRAFQAADAQDFFGREKLIQKLLKRLQEESENHRLLAVVGPSGSGKSSVVKAGLIPALWRGELPGSENWYIVDMLPGDRPLDELEIALLRVADDRSLNLHEQLERDNHGLLRVADLILPDAKSELLLVIDQFEEVFTLVTDEQERLHFLNLLHEAVTRERSRVRVIVTLRADYYDRPLQYPDFGELMRSRVETVLPLSAEELEHAVREPANAVAVRFEDGLVSRIVSDVHYQPGALPLLQYALTELFERRDGRMLTQAAYEAIGGTGGALANRADEIYLEQDEAGRELIRQIFLRLVTLGEGAEDTRRRVPRSELLSIVSPPPILPHRNGEGGASATEGVDMMDELIDLYAASRLLSLDNDPNTRTPTVEVAHEAILREWERLRTWLNESREDIRQQRIVAQATEAWQANQKDTSYLLSGNRLEQVEKWSQLTELALTPLEREFIETSIAQRAAQQKTESERQARENRLEQRSRNFLRGLVAVFAIATLIAIAESIFALSERNRATSALAGEQAARATSEANAQLSQSLALASGAQVALSEGNVDLALSLAVVANQIEEPPALAQRMLFEAAYGPGVVRVFSGHTDAVRSVSVSPDGRTILSASQDGSLILWDVQTGEQLRQFTGHEGNVWSVVFHPDGRTALSGSADKTMILWDVETGEPIRRFVGHTTDVRMVAISPDGRTALSASYDHLAILWDMETGTEIRRFVGHEDGVWTVAFSPDSRTMLSGSGNQEGFSPDTTMRLWNLETGEEIHRFEAHTDTVRTVAFSPDGRTALSGSFDTTLILWDLNTGAEIRRFEGHTARVTGVVFSSDGRRAISSSVDTTLILWDVATGQPIHQFKGHSDAVVSVALGSDGHSAFSAAHDRTLRLWDLESTAEVYQLASTLPVAVAMYTAFSPDGETLVVRLGPTNVALRDTETGQVIRYLEGYEGDHLFREDIDSANLIRSVAFSPDGRTLATGFEERGWILWDVATGQAIRHFGGEPQWAFALAFSPDGQWVATGGDPIIRIWDVETGEEVRRFEGYTDQVNELAFSPDGRYLAAAFGSFTSAVGGGTTDTSLRIWDVNTGEEIRRIEHPAQVTGVAFSPSGQTLYSSSFDGAIREWDFSSGQELRHLVGSESGIVKLALSADGSYLITGTYSGEIVVWSAATGEQLRRFRVGSEPTSVAISPDRTYALVGGGDDGALHMWRLALNLDELLDWTYANREVRELNCTERELYRIEPPCNADGTLPTNDVASANR